MVKETTGERTFWSSNALTFRKSTVVVRSLEALSFLSLFHAHGMIVPTLFPFYDIILLELRMYLLDTFYWSFYSFPISAPSTLLLLILLFPYFSFFFLPISFLLSFQNYDMFTYPKWVLKSLTHEEKKYTILPLQPAIPEESRINCVWE